MSGVTKKLISASGGAGALAIEDAFSTFLYTGNGSTQTITNGIDLAGEGGLVWIKCRSAGGNSTADHRLFDTERGATKVINSRASDAEVIDADTLTAFNADGFSLGADIHVNTNSATYVSWSFRKAPNLFDVVKYTGNGGSLSVSHNLGVIPAVIIIKDLSVAGDWLVYHRSVYGASNGFIRLNRTDEAQTKSVSNTFVGNVSSITDLSFTLNAGSSTNTITTSGNNYVAYIFAHDTEAEGLIQCGSYTGNGSAAGPVVDLGWEPQWLLIKRANANGNWNLIDNARGFTVSGTDAELNPNLSLAESSGTFVSPSSTGFQINTIDADYNASGSPFIFIAIRAEGV